VRSAEIARLLPDVFQYALRPPDAGVVEPDRRMAALLAVMEGLHQPVEDVLDGLHEHLDPRLAPARFVPYLAGWVDLDWLLMAAPGQPVTGPVPLASGMDRLRELVAAASYLARWRGTARGLLRFLDSATGVTGFLVEENVTVGETADGPQRRPKPFHIRVLAPPGAEPYRPLIERIVAAEKPAYVTWELAFTTGATGAVGDVG
jgi:phage tail-like protein